MKATLIDGQKVAESIHKDIKAKVASMKVKPGLAVVIVGNNAASKIYVKKKEKACKEAGFHSVLIELSEDISETKLLKQIDALNQDNKIHGILVQLPLPKHIDERLVIDAIHPNKDVDGFTPLNMGNLMIGDNRIVPSTPRGIIKLIESTGVEISGKHAVVVGRSNIVGKPVSVLLQQHGATVTMCHSRSLPLEYFTRQADILVAAVGKPKFIKGSMIKKGAVVIDVGINKVGDSIVGDVDFDSASEVASFITPVPGGVGPMTIACLLENTIQAAEILFAAQPLRT
ncbi:MAG TPA: bifunctional methylenetetrahydrofolate dehydrogenase/methenyltetrahydrofolate cyclohydrolase FolD [Candidatus Nanoarchaeia archaeon]|nr:bifunctional methylenetetrahydrofolate dehydrogenase/methenyltetrahydrofolate cyclohydrolase FolD [Candidatus Nanoarchaeia archaeon]